MEGRLRGVWVVLNARFVPVAGRCGAAAGGGGGEVERRAVEGRLRGMWLVMCGVCVVCECGLYRRIGGVMGAKCAC